MVFFGLTLFLQFGSVFFRFSLVFLSVFSGLGSVRFLAYKAKTEPNRTEPVGFLKILIDCFSRFGFFSYFFSGFLGLISFSVFLLALGGFRKVICNSDSTDAIRLINDDFNKYYLFGSVIFYIKEVLTWN